MNKQRAEGVAALVMRRLTIYPGNLEDLADEFNNPDPGILDDLAETIWGMPYSPEDEALSDLVGSLQVDNTAGNTGDEENPSRMVMGNVSLKTLQALGIIKEE